MAFLEETLQSLGFGAPATTRIGRRFEHFIQQVFLLHPGEYGQERFEEVWLWSEWPDRERWGFGSDYGIDLVAKQTSAFGGGLCAIQCKYRAEGSVSTSEVNSFLAAVGDTFTASLLVSSAPISRKGLEKIERASPRCQLLYTAEMDDWVEDWRGYAEHPESLEIPPPKRHVLHDFQQDAVNKVLQGFAEADRGQLILPCGTGKSFVGLQIAERLAGVGARVLYLVPSIALVGQTMREWSAQRSVPLEYLGVCSDPTAGRKASERVDLASDLAELAIPVTTHPEKIRATLTKPVSPGAMQVVFCTYHSSPLIKKAASAGGVSFDLVICDEAHRTTGVEFSKGGDDLSYYRIVHHDEHIRAAKRLYMTATPRVFTDAAKRKLGELREGEDPDCYDMGDEKTYGREFYRMSFGEAVKKEYLSDYEILVIVASAEAYYAAVGDSHERIVGEDGGIYVDDAVKLAGCWDALASPESVGVSPGGAPGRLFPKGGAPARSAIAFTNRVKTSEWVADTWEKIVSTVTKDKEGSGFLKLNVEHVDGSTPAAERVKYLRSLESSGNGTRNGEAGGSRVCEVVSNARVLSEGVNVPSLDAVLFLDPRSSSIDITQQVGRVMRKAPGKQKGYIVIPVVVPEFGDPKAMLAASDWRVVWEVVKALRSHDERLNYYVNLEAAWKKNAPLRVGPSRLGLGQLDDPDDDVIEVHAPSVQQLQLALSEAIASMVVERCGDRNIYPTWGRRATEVCQRVETRIEKVTGAGGQCELAFRAFLEGLETSVGRSVEVADAQQMVSQHIVTIPVFDAMLGKNEFSQHNPVSREIERLLDDFRQHGISFEGETRPLARPYKGMSEAFEGAVTSSEKLDILRRIYENFFKAAMADTVKRLGIVYTPVEIADFMLRSVAAICKKEFRRNISSEGVTVLDPFTGTGTFLAGLIEMRDNNGEHIVKNEDLNRKYQDELHANELVLLAYYIAALRIEEAKHTRDAEMSDGEVAYTPFEKIVLTDTFCGAELGEKNGQLPINFMANNVKNRLRQDQTHMMVILGNPPWSAGMKSSSDNTKNLEYDEIAERIKKTYGVKHREVLGKSSGVKAFGNLYVKAFRWATDRILPGESQDELAAIISFVHPNSLTDGPSLAGVRASMREDFTDIYVVNLRGNAYKSGEERRREGDEVFGGGSRNGVQITFLVRNPEKDLSKPATLRYIEVPDRKSVDEKFAWLKDLGDITSHKLAEVPINSRHDWINISDGSYEKLLAVCDTNKQNKHTAFSKHALGLATACDVYVYSFSRNELEKKVQRLINEYNNALQRLKVNPELFEEVTGSDTLSNIKWTDALKSSLRRRTEIEFAPGRIREVLYRPFTKLWLYEDDRILSAVRTVSKMFPRNEGVEGFEVTGGSNNSSPDSYIAGARRAGPPAGGGGGGPPPPSRAPPPANAAVAGLPAPGCIGDLCAVGTQQASRGFPRQRFW